MFVVRDFASASHKGFYLEGSSNFETPFKTVIIGDNASGKTRFITALIDTFRRIHHASREKGKSKTNNLRLLREETTSLSYQTSHGVVKALLASRGIEFWLDGESVEASKIPLPARVIAISSAFNDKYPFTNNDEEEDGGFYKYCGLRETTNASWSATLARKTIENLLKMDAQSAAEPLGELFSHLKILTKFRIRLSIAKPRIFQSAMESPASLLSYLHSYSGRAGRMQVSMFMNASDEDLQTVFRGYRWLNRRDAKSCHFDIDLEGDGRHHVDVYNFLNICRRVGLIKDMRLELYSSISHGAYDFYNASSGESHLLYGFSSILRFACENSLILIDEPEISLHPAWQIRYIGLLKKALTKINSCHLIIATHSHFILSDLDQENSSLHIFKKRYDGRARVENVEYSTYAWSPENILYSVFNVRTVGNPAFEKDLQDALDIIAKKNNDTTRLIDLGKKFENLVFDSSDPLNAVVDAIRVYLDGNN